MKIKAEVGGRRVSVEGEDVLAWRGDSPTATTDATEVARAHAAAYVEANPRPDPDAQGAVNVPARQRMALLQRLTSGPATKRQLLRAMRGAAGYVGGDDWRNRYDELRGHGKRGGGHLALPIEHDTATDTYRLTRSFATLSPEQRHQLATAKALLNDVDHPAVAVLDELFPDVAATQDVFDQRPPLRPQPVGSRRAASNLR